MKSRNSISKTFKRAISARRSRGEQGGVLLPIVVLCVLAVSIAATLSSSTIMTSKIVKQQNVASAMKLTHGSIETSVLRSISKGARLNGTGVLPGVGSYKLFYTTAAAQPTETSTMTAVGANALITVSTKWLRLETTTEDGVTKKAIYRYYPPNSAITENAVEWSGPVTLTNTTVSNAAGVTGGGGVYLRPTTMKMASSTIDNPTRIVSPTVSYTLNGAVFNSSVYTAGPINATGGKFKGNLYTSSTNATNIEGVFGDTIKSYTGAQPFEWQNVVIPTTSPWPTTNMVCGTKEAGKAFVEALAVRTEVNMGTCKLEGMTVKLKTDLIFKPGATESIKDTTFTSSNGSSAFLRSGTSSTNWTGLKTSGSAKIGLIPTTGFTLKKSNFVGFISGGHTSGMTLEDVNLRYTPTEGMRQNVCTTGRNCVLSAKKPVLVRVQ